MEGKNLLKRVSGRNILFLFKASLFTLLFVALGQTVSAQATTLGEAYQATSEVEVAIRQQGGDFVEEAAALSLLGNEIVNLRDSSPTSATEETSNAMKYQFAVSAGKALKANQTVEESLRAGYEAIQGFTRTHATQVPTQPILNYYVSLLGR